MDIISKFIEAKSIYDEDVVGKIFNMKGIYNNNYCDQHSKICLWHGYKFLCKIIKEYSIRYNFYVGIEK